MAPGLLPFAGRLVRSGHGPRLVLGALSALAIAIAGCAPAPATPPAQATLASMDAIQVRLTEWEVLVTPSAIGSGQLRFAVTNMGSMPHAFEIEGATLRREATELNPGQTANMLADLRPGTYILYCSLADHRERGMRAPLVVN